MRNGLSYSEAGKLGWIASKETQQNQKRRRIEKYYQNPKKCKFCGKPIPYEKKSENKFCDHSCAACFNNNGIRRKGKPPGFCKCCGKPKRSAINIYCCSQCQMDYAWRKRKNKIEKTGIEKSVTVVKKYLREKYGNYCFICGITEWTGQPVPLELDHINGNFEDSRLKNQRLICGNCGMLLPTYKGRNHGNGRHKRRQRYKEGKSY